MRMHAKDSKWILFAGLVAALLAGAFAAEAEPGVVVPFGEARFVPLDSSRPDGPAIAVLRGDPDQGPSDMLLKLKKGSGRLHLHTSDYHLVVLQGMMKHWVEGEKEAEAPPLGPGSYWFQPGNQAHGDSCLTDECLMFIKWDGKRDARLAQPAPAEDRSNSATTGAWSEGDCPLRSLRSMAQAIARS